MGMHRELTELDDERGEESPEVPLNGKTFVARGVVLSKAGLERLATAHDVKNELVFSNPIPVFDVFHKRKLGFASVVWEGDLLLATVYLDSATPERLDIENGENVWAEASFMNNGRFRPVDLRDFWLTKKKPADDAETPLKVIERE